MNPWLRARRLKHLAQLAAFRRRYDWDRTAPPGDGTLVLFYNGIWGRPPRLPADGLPPGCEITMDPRRMREASAVVFHIPSLGSLAGARKFPGQLWVAMSRESDAHYPRQRDPAFMERFDISVTHERRADVVAPYYGPALEQLLARPPSPKAPDRLAALFLSGRHDASGRAAYAAELMRHIDVHSYGRRLRNRRLPRDEGAATKLETIAGYKFTLAFENARAPDYVTEKLYDPLVAGSVPVYLGAPNVDELAPADRCLIDVTRFRGPEQLARHLLELDRDDAAYEEYLRWKREPLRPAFLRLLEEQRVHWLVRLFEAVRARSPAPVP